MKLNNIKIISPLIKIEKKKNSFFVNGQFLNDKKNFDIKELRPMFVNLFDIIGRKVFTKFFKNNSSQFSETFDFSSLSSGVYMLDVDSGGKRAIKKIIIQ